MAHPQPLLQRLRKAAAEVLRVATGFRAPRELGAGPIALASHVDVCDRGAGASAGQHIAKSRNSHCQTPGALSVEFVAASVDRLQSPSAEAPRYDLHILVCLKRLPLRHVPKLRVAARASRVLHQEKLLVLEQGFKEPRHEVTNLVAHLLVPRQRLPVASAVRALEGAGAPAPLQKVAITRARRLDDPHVRAVRVGRRAQQPLLHLAPRHVVFRSWPAAPLWVLVELNGLFRQQPEPSPRLGYPGGARADLLQDELAPRQVEVALGGLFLLEGQRHSWQDTADPRIAHIFAVEVGRAARADQARPGRGLQPGGAATPAAPADLPRCGVGVATRAVQEELPAKGGCVAARSDALHHILKPAGAGAVERRARQSHVAPVQHRPEVARLTRQNVLPGHRFHDESPQVVDPQHDQRPVSKLIQR